MPDKAAIQADYIDKHYMKTTGAVRFVFEVSKENATAAEAVMGLPAHGGNRWCAIALLNDVAEQNQQTSESELPAFIRDMEEA